MRRLGGQQWNSLRQLTSMSSLLYARDMWPVETIVTFAYAA